MCPSEKPKASASSAGLTKADKSLEKTLSSKMLPEKASRRKGEKTPSAKSEPARFVTSPSNRSDSESSGKGRAMGVKRCRTLRSGRRTSTS